MQKLFHFLQYHNAVPIALGLVFLGSGITFAATNPDAIYSTEQEVISIDNTYLVDKDLAAYTPTVEIQGVTEDEEQYYVAYAFNTIDLEDYVWRDVSKEGMLKVSKADLGPYRDLGVYVTEQLKQLISRELARLTETQDFERKQVSQKVVATIYGGLVGKMLNATTETLPGYTPVVTPPVETSSQVASAAGASGASSGGSSGGQSALLSLQVLGNNPARIPVGATYVDLGVVLLDPTNSNLGYHTFVNDVEMVVPQIDTSTSTAHTIEYRATDPNGVKLVARRIVLVGDAADPGGEVSVAGNISGVQASAPTDSGSSSDGDSETSATTSTTPAATSAHETSGDVASTTPAATSTPSDTQEAVTSAPESASSTPATTEETTATSAETYSESVISTSTATSTGE